MTSADRLNGLMPTQKQEWVTPKISLMEAEDTDGKINQRNIELSDIKGPS